MHSLVVDDDPVSCALLRHYLESVPAVLSVATARNGQEATEELARKTPDFLVLDVEMPGISGLDLLSLISPRPPVIVVSGSSGYAARAFDLDVTDFVVKPVSMSRFCKAIDRVQRRLQFEQGASGSLNAAIEDVFVREGGKLVRIALSDVSNFEAQGDYVLSHVGDRSLMMHTTMKALLERLPGHQFVRIHRSHIVFIRAIADIEDMSLVLRNGTVLPIGQSYRQALLKVLYTL